MTALLHCETLGQGPDVMVLHGLFGAGRNWLTVARRLAAHYTFHLVDLRNHGRSPHLPAMGYLDMAADVRALAAHLALDAYTLVGHSMGGKVAMTLALTDARALARLVLIDIAPAAYPDRFAEMIAGLRALDLHTIRRRADADAQLAAVIPETTVRQFILQNLVFHDGRPAWRANLAVLQDQMPYILGPLPVSPAARYTGPTWFIRGELSDRVTAAHEPTIARYFPRHRIATVAGGGHWPHAEAPAAFMALFEQALDAA